MAQHKSAIKRIRQNEKRNERNRKSRSNLRTEIKKFKVLLETEGMEKIQAAFPKLQKIIDKAVTKGILHKSTANRKKARLAGALQKKTAEAAAS